MPSTYKTPGVYVEEISKFPPSVAQVETAVPAFIGYTAMASRNGESLIDKPTKINSLLEFENYFGTAYEYVAGDIDVTVDTANNFAVTTVEYANVVYRMYDSLRMFFNNGGGKCYIIAVNTHAGAAGLYSGGELTDAAELADGLAILEKYDEPTIILFPDAVQLNETNFFALQQAAIEQSAKLQDRVAVLDLKENLASPSSWDNSVENFRNNIGINDLKYAMAYTPWLYNAFTYSIDYNLFRNNVNAGAVTLSSITSDAQLNAMVTTLEAICDDITNVIDPSVTTLVGTFATIKDRFYAARNAVLTSTDATAIANFTLLIQVVRDLALVFPAWISGGTPLSSTILVQDLNSYATDTISGLRKYVTDLVGFENNTDVVTLNGGAASYASYDNIPAATPNSWLGQNAGAIAASGTDYGAGADRATALSALSRTPVLAMDTNLDLIFDGLYKFLTKIIAAADQRKLLAQNTLYNNHQIIGNIVSAVQKFLSLLPPSGAVAGIYAKVDNDRGVWKAPANVSISSVIGPSVVIDNSTQDDLNVDVNAGKSINAIRSFTSKGTIIWGARTLAGNDNEWRYVPVRRFFNMVEESVKKASSQFVFEPNDANTWVKIKAMIENYLTILWRQGALAGAKAEQAFFVKVGLGETMTSIDILEGRMNIEIGMAAVRPAEFIILKFSHKMQES